MYGFSKGFDKALKELMDAEVQVRIAEASTEPLASIDLDGGLENGAPVLEVFTRRLTDQGIANVALVLLDHCLKKHSLFYYGDEHKIDTGNWSHASLDLPQE